MVRFADPMTTPGLPQQDGYYRTRFAAVPGRDRAWVPICRHLQRFVGVHAKVLDLGAGYCSFINNIDAREKHALDAFAGFTQYANADVRAHVGVCSDLSRFSDATFTVVFASNLLEHLTRAELSTTIDEVRRVLQSAGRLILIQPNYRYCFREYFDDYTHTLVFSHVSLADLLSSCGFVIERVDARFLPLTFKSRLPPWPWLVRLYLALPYRPMGKQMLVVARRREGAGN